MQSVGQSNPDVLQQVCLAFARVSVGPQFLSECNGMVRFMLVRSYLGSTRSNMTGSVLRSHTMKAWV